MSTLPRIAQAKEEWRGVRRERAEPPALAGQDEDRRQVFQAALAQAEELWDAAAVAGPASRPLPLFYCLSQAGRAVCAAWTRSEEWRPRHHGLRRRESAEPTPQARAFDYATAVTSGPLGIYGMVAEATASSTFAGYATVAGLWASLPGWPTPDSVFGDRPRCLRLERVRLSTDRRPRRVQLLTPTHAIVRFRKIDVAEAPSLYPTMAGIEQDGFRNNPFGGTDPIYRFLGDDGTPRPLSELGDLWPGEPALTGDIVVRPRVGDDPVGPPSAFLTLWALLFCLSELARYYPDTWVGALDPDRSRVAVTLESGLDRALEQAPQLISRALRGPIDKLVREELRRQQAEASADFADPAPADGPTTQS